MKRINKITIERVDDPCGSPAYLGEYSDTPKGQIRFELPQRGYFNATRATTVNEGHDDYLRAEAFNNGEWGFIGIKAVAEIHVGTGTVQVVRLESPGLWGIENDSDESYFEEVGAEQVVELTELLTEFGFTLEEIAEVKPTTGTGSPQHNFNMLDE